MSNRNKTIDSITNNSTKKAQSRLIKSLAIARNEKDVENNWREWFNSIFESQVSSPFGTDGYIDSPLVSCLLEFKYDVKLESSIDCAKVLIQVIYYLKKFQTSGMAFPKAIFIGDINECFVLDVHSLVKYLNYNLDWNIAPSQAAEKNPTVLVEIANDKEISPFVYQINQNFDALSFVHKIINITLSKPVAVPITSKNIVNIFEQFKKTVIGNGVKKIFKDKKDEEAEKDLVDIFFKSLIQSNDVYLHPKKNNLLCTPNGEINVDSRSFRAFFSSFRQNYTSSELEDLTANKDRILENEHRRRTGAFFTPQIWADYAHKMIAEQFGEDWKEKYVVWDCACGTANLTRGYKFKELYLSTIEQHDIDIIKTCGYNREATVFQYDFLSEVGFDGVPEGLKKALDEGRVIAFMNPPYGTANNMSTDIEAERKKGCAQTIVNNEMKVKGIGSSSQQLYAQFIYKFSLKKIDFCTFAPPLFISGPSFDKFREKLLWNYSFCDGVVFQASHFADVASQWGISFTIWKGNQ